MKTSFRFCSPESRHSATLWKMRKLLQWLSVFVLKGKLSLTNYDRSMRYSGGENACVVDSNVCVWLFFGNDALFTIDFFNFFDAFCKNVFETRNKMICFCETTMPWHWIWNLKAPECIHYPILSSELTGSVLVSKCRAQVMGAGDESVECRCESTAACSQWIKALHGLISQVLLFRVLGPSEVTLPRLYIH